MSQAEVHVVTGAFGYSGRFIARRLLEAGREVRTLTNSDRREHPFGQAVRVFPLRFELESLLPALRGADVLYNTYWVRFNHADFSHSQAVRNTEVLFEAAQIAGVRRVVHVSITNPSEDSPFEYFRGKGRLERVLRESGLSHAILRPAVLFGEGDILVNNIAWTLRHLPVFGVFGPGTCGIEPIHVDDLARLAVEYGAAAENAVVNAIGPQSFTYRSLVAAVGEAIGCSRPIVSVPPALGLLAGRILGWFLDDVMITREEIGGLNAGLLAVETPPTGTVRLTDWAKAQADQLGRRYASELARRRDRQRAYQKL